MKLLKEESVIDIQILNGIGYTGLETWEPESWFAWLNGLVVHASSRGHVHLTGFDYYAWHHLNIR